MKKKILVVEDDVDIADLVKMVLESAEFEVTTVLDPLRAYDTAVALQPDAIMLDLSMPRMGGWDVFKILRADVRFKQVPVAILTAKSEAMDAMVGLHVMKADAYITKPFGKQELINRTYELLRQRKK